jgi:hypothetical protein
MAGETRDLLLSGAPSLDPWRNGAHNRWLHTDSQRPILAIDGTGNSLGRCATNPRPARPEYVTDLFASGWELRATAQSAARSRFEVDATA